MVWEICLCDRFGFFWISMRTHHEFGIISITEVSIDEDRPEGPILFALSDHVTTFSTKERRLDICSYFPFSLAETFPREPIIDIVACIYCRYCKLLTLDVPSGGCSLSSNFVLYYLVFTLSYCMQYQNYSKLTHDDVIKWKHFQISNSNSKKVYCHKLHQHQQHTYMQVFWDNEGYWSKMSLLVPLWDVNITNHLPNGSKQSMIQFSTTRAKV